MTRSHRGGTSHPRAAPVTGRPNGGAHSRDNRLVAPSGFRPDLPIDVDGSAGWGNGAIVPIPPEQGAADVVSSCRRGTRECARSTARFPAESNTTDCQRLSCRALVQRITVAGLSMLNRKTVFKPNATVSKADSGLKKPLHTFIVVFESSRARSRRERGARTVTVFVDPRRVMLSARLNLRAVAAARPRYTSPPRQCPPTVLRCAQAADHRIERTLILWPDFGRGDAVVDVAGEERRNR